MSETGGESEEEYVHFLLQQQAIEDHLIAREMTLLDDESVNLSLYNKITASLSGIRENRKPEVIANEELSLAFYARRRQDPQLSPPRFFETHYFQIVGDCLRTSEVCRLEPDGSCSREIRIGTKLLLHELGIDYPGKEPFENYP